VLKTLAGKGLLPSFLGASAGDGSQAPGAIVVVTAVAAVLALGGREGLSGIIESSALMFGVIFSLVCAGDLLKHDGAGGGNGGRKVVASKLLGFGAALTMTAIALGAGFDLKRPSMSLLVVMGWLVALVPFAAVRWRTLKRSRASPARG
jgi:hypothetical protein